MDKAVAKQPLGPKSQLAVQKMVMRPGGGRWTRRLLDKVEGGGGTMGHFLHMHPVPLFGFHSALGQMWRRNEVAAVGKEMLSICTDAGDGSHFVAW